jgi:hypothetical protein
MFSSITRNEGDRSQSYWILAFSTYKEIQCHDDHRTAAVLCSIGSSTRKYMGRAVCFHAVEYSAGA